MTNTISSRATFYDLTGYLLPGSLLIGIVWLYWYAFGDSETAIRFLRRAHHLGSFWLAIGVIVVGYFAGHLANSASSMLFEGCIFKSAFKNWRDWYGRMNDDRKARVDEVAMREFGVPAKELKVFDVRVRMENTMPNAAITGLCFLSYYGMSRTLSLLSFLVVPVLIAIWLSQRSFCLGVVVVPVAVGLFFGYQYSRFVVYYCDFLGSTLLNDKVGCNQSKGGFDGRKS